MRRRREISTAGEKTRNYQLLLSVSQEALQYLQITSSEVHEFLGPGRVSVLNRFFRLEQVPFHARLAGDHIAAKSVAGSTLLLLQAIQAIVHRGSAVGKLVNLVL